MLALSPIFRSLLMGFVIFVLAFVYICFGKDFQNATCLSRHNCPKDCALNSAIVALLADRLDGPSLSYWESIRKAVKIIKSFSNHGVKYDDQLFLHSTIMYPCCYSVEDYEQIIYPAIEQVQWEPFNISFDKAVCNYDNSTNTGTNVTTMSIILLCNNETQIRLSALVKKFENAVAQKGLKVYPRKDMEHFHSTIAVVEENYPVADALEKINSNIVNWIPLGGAIEIKTLLAVMPPYIFYGNKTRFKWEVFLFFFFFFFSSNLMSQRPSVNRRNFQEISTMMVFLLFFVALAFGATPTRPNISPIFQAHGVVNVDINRQRHLRGG